MRKFLVTLLLLLAGGVYLGSSERYESNLVRKKAGSTLLEVMPSGSVFVYQLGADVSVSGIGTTVSVWDSSSIQVGDTVEIDGQTATVLTVPSATSFTIDTSVTFDKYDRVLRTSAQVNIYSDSILTTLITQPAVANSSGRVLFWYNSAQYSAFDIKVVSGGATTVYADVSSTGGGGSTLTYLDIRDYGAVADDGADDQVAIAASIAACPAEPAHCTIYFPDGAWHSKKTTNINRGRITLLGDGGATINVLDDSDASTNVIIFQIQPSPLTSATRFTNVRIQGLRGVDATAGAADGPTEETHFIVMRQVDGFLLRDLYASGFGDECINVLHSTNGTVENCELSACVGTSAAGAGGLGLTHASRVQVIRNIISNNAQYNGIRYEAPSENQCESSICKTNGAACTTTNDCNTYRQVVISENIINSPAGADSNSSCVLVNNAQGTITDLQINSNACYDPDGKGFIINPVGGVVENYQINNNICSGGGDNADTGAARVGCIYVGAAADKGVVDGNIVNDFGDGAQALAHNGIAVIGESAVISNNHITAPTSSCIWSDSVDADPTDGEANLIIGNTCISPVAGTHGIRGEGGDVIKANYVLAAASTNCYFIDSGTSAKMIANAAVGCPTGFRVDEEVTVTDNHCLGLITCISVDASATTDARIGFNDYDGSTTRISGSTADYCLTEALGDTCVAVDSDRMYGDLDCDCVKDVGEVYFDGAAASGYSTVDDENTPLTQRTTLNFAGAGVSCADDVDQTTCTIAGGGSVTVEEADGAPTVAGVSVLQFDQADGFVLTDEGGGTVELDLDALPLANVSITSTSLLDLSGIDSSTLTEGLLLPQHATACATGFGEGQLCWEATANPLLRIGNGTAFEDFYPAGTMTDGLACKYDLAGNEIDCATDLDALYQPLDSELSTIAGLAETNGNVMFVAGGAWTSDPTPAIDCTDCINIPPLNTVDIDDATWSDGLTELEISYTYNLSAGTDPIVLYQDDNVDFSTPVSATSFTADPSATPTTQFDDTIDADGTPEAQIVADANAADNGEISLQVETADGVYTEGLRVESNAGVLSSVLSGKNDRNNVAVNDNDCTGEQGLWWFDTTDNAFEFCNANSGAPATLAAASGDVSDVGSCTGGACFTDGNLTSGTTLMVWEGNVADAEQVTFAMSSVEPAAAYTLTFPDETGTIATSVTALGGDVSGTLGAVVVDDVQTATANLEAVNNNTTQVATTSFVQQEINGAGGTNLSCSGGTCNVDDVFLLNTGDIGTGTFDFGGATSFEIRNNNDPTLTIPGEVAVDSNSGALRFYGAAQRVIVPSIRNTITIEDPTATENITMGYFNRAATLVACRCVTVGGASPSVTMAIKVGTDRSAAGTTVCSGAVSTAGATSSATVGDVTGGDLTLDSSTIAASSHMWLTTSASSPVPDELSCTVRWNWTAVN